MKLLGKLQVLSPGRTESSLFTFHNLPNCFTAEEIPEELQAKLLSDYEKERKETLRCRDKDDMVLVSRPGETDSPSKG